MFNTTLNKISVKSWGTVLLVEETGLPGENYQPVASLWQTLSYNGEYVETFKMDTIFFIGINDHDVGSHWLIFF